MSIQRWDMQYSATPLDDGEFVTYADHVAALAEAEAEWQSLHGKSVMGRNEYERGHEDERKRSVLLIADAYGKGLDAARDAVENLPVAISVVHDTWFLNKQGMRVCENPDDYPHGIVQVAALAAIDALRATP